MDPDSTLASIRELIQAAKTDDAVYHEEAWYFFDLVEQLDEWIQRGGMLPTNWLPAFRIGDQDE